MSKRSKERKITQETKDKISLAKKGQSPFRPGYKHTEETKNKISEANKRNGNKPPSRKGCKLSEEYIKQRKKLKEQNKLTLTNKK